MTICVAALCNGGRAIMTASDRMMAWGPGVTAETSLKYDVIHGRWAVMIAGDDIMPTEPMIRQLREALAQHEAPRVAVVEGAIRDVWRNVKNQIAETTVLSPYNITLDAFVRKGRNLFGELVFADMCSAIQRAGELSCELLVHGFEENDSGHILHVVNPGEPVNFERLGFAAIGSGRDSAMASLMWEPAHRSYGMTSDAIYRVCAAKFMAETALGVGRNTVVCGFHANGDRFVLDDERVAKVRRLWETDGRPKIPKASQLIFLTEMFGLSDEKWRPLGSKRTSDDDDS
jgi:hypothetical protein